MIELRDKRYEQVRLIFHEDGHKYNDTFGNEFISTTTLLHNYVPKFDKDYWLKKKAKELGISEKRLEKQWQDITDEACKRGTATHNGLEDGIKDSSMFKKAVQYMIKENGEMITVADIPLLHDEVKSINVEEFREMTENKYPEIYRVFQWYTDRGYKIYSEIGMFLIDSLISGTIDVLLIRDEDFVIGDWKTNRGGLQFESGYYKKDKTQTPAQMTNVWINKKEYLLPPVANLPNCNGSVYNLQLSLYAYAVQKILGLPCKGLWLCHIDSDFVLNEYGMPKRFPDGLYHVKNNPIEKTTFHKMLYRYNEIQRIVADRERNIRAARVTSNTLF